MSHKIKVFGSKNSDKSKFLSNVYLIVLGVIVIGGGLAILHLVNESNDYQKRIDEQAKIIVENELLIKDMAEANDVIVQKLEDEKAELEQGNEALLLQIEQLQQQVSNKDKVINTLEQEKKKLKEKANANFSETSRGGGYQVEGTYRTFEMTSYTAYCDTGCNGITALGVDVSNTIHHQNKRVIAVDPRVIPLGSVVEIRRESGEVFQAIAIDTGGAIKGQIVDLLVGSKSKARQNGRESVQIKIIN